MPKYLDETGLAHFWGNVKDVTDGLDERVAKFEKKVLVVLGDSWSDGSNDPDNTWYMQVADKLGFDAYVTNAKAGKGFAYGTTNTIPLQVAGAATLVENAGYTANDVKCVIAFGGVNDYRHSQNYANVASGMKTTYDNARATFPIAEIFIIGPNAGKWDVMDTLDSTSSDKASSYFSFPNYIHSIKSNLHNSGYPIVWDAGAWLNNYGKDAGNLYNSDLLHPNQTGHNVIASYVCEILLGCYNGVHSYRSQSNIAAGTSGVTSPINYSVSVDNGIATIQFDALGDVAATTSTVYWTLDNFPLMPGGTSRPAYRAGFVCSNFTNSTLPDGYEPIRGYFNPSNRRLTIYPSAAGGINQLFGTVSLNVY